MTSILAIETSTPACSVALLVGDTKFCRYSEEPRSHTRLIMGMIDEVLSEAGITVDSLDALAVTVGPGSFTGLRIGFSTVPGSGICCRYPGYPSLYPSGNGADLQALSRYRFLRNCYVGTGCTYGRVQLWCLSA